MLIEITENQALILHRYLERDWQKLTKVDDPKIRAIQRMREISSIDARLMEILQPLVSLIPTPDSW